MGKIFLDALHPPFLHNKQRVFQQFYDTTLHASTKQHPTSTNISRLSIELAAIVLDHKMLAPGEILFFYYYYFIILMIFFMCDL